MSAPANNPFRSNEDLWEMDRAHAMHPWANFGPFEKEGSLVINRGEDVWLWDTEGNRYLDAVGGMWCTNIGLGRKEMAQAIAEQAERLAYTNYFVDVTSDTTARLAAKLAEIAPGDLNRVHFTTGGSTAVDTAVRMVPFYHTAKGNPDKTGIVARKNSYHGATYLTQSVGKRPGDQVEGFRYMKEGIWHLSAPNMYRRPEGLSETEFCDHLVQEFEDLIAKVGADRIGGFIAEPIQASGGIIIPPEGYFRRMWEVCQRHDILFIADEVVTGFGRLGHWFASQDVFGVTPDIITSAKGLTSGYVPAGAVIFSDRVYDTMAQDAGGWFTSGYTYSGHPVSSAAALKNIEIMERENLLDHAKKSGAYFQERLKPFEDLPMIGNVRGRGLLICVESVADKTTKALLPDEANEAKRISNVAESLGLMVRPLGHLNVMSPALTITEAQIDQVAETLEKSIRKVADDLTREGYKVG